MGGDGGCCPTAQDRAERPGVGGARCPGWLQSAEIKAPFGMADIALAQHRPAGTPGPISPHSWEPAALPCCAVGWILQRALSLSRSWELMAQSWLRHKRNDIFPSSAADGAPSNCQKRGDFHLLVTGGSFKR